jgi:hypothetical protein
MTFTFLRLGKILPSLSKQNAFHKSIGGTTKMYCPYHKTFLSSLQQRPLAKVTVFFFSPVLHRHVIRGKTEAKEIKKDAVDS